MDIDPSKGWRTVDERLSRTTNPRHRGMLEILLGHLKSEADLDIDGLLEGQVDEPQYHIWASGIDTGPKGRKAVIDYYTTLAEEKRGILEYDIERMVVDDDTIVTEGWIHAYQPGPVAQGFGYDIDDLDATYRVSYRALVLWPFNEEGQLIGEDGYAGIHPAAAVKVDPADLPEVYTAQF